MEAVKVLIEAGAGYNDMANVKDKEGWTPLHRACQQPPPKEKPRSQNNNEEGAPSEEKPGMKNSILGMHVHNYLLYL